VRLLQQNAASTADELQAKILKAAGDFCHNHWQDDATLLVLAVS